MKDPHAEEKQGNSKTQIELQVASMVMITGTKTKVYLEGGGKDRKHILLCIVSRRLEGLQRTWHSERLSRGGEP